MAPQDFDDPAAPKAPRYDFDAMTDFDLEELLRRGPGEELGQAIEDLRVGVDLEQKVRGLVAKGVRLGAALAKSSLAGG